MKNKRILQVIDSMGFGGAEKVVMTLSQGFIERGHSVDVIIIDDKEVFVLDTEVKLHKLGFKKSWRAYPRYSKKLHAMIKDMEYRFGEFDLILVHLQQSIRLMRTFKHQKTFFCLHSSLAQSSLSGRKGLRLWLKKRRLQKIYNGLDLIAVSHGVADDATKNVEIRPKSIQTIYNPVDFEEIKKLSNKDNTICQHENFIVHVGRLASVKRHDLLIKAYKASGIDTKLVLVGDGPLRHEIEILIEEEGLRDSVLLTGYMENPYNCIARASLLVLCSDYEGFGNVLVEALALGTSVISTDCPSGPNEILKGSLARWLVPVDDQDALAFCINDSFINKTSDPNDFSSYIEQFDVKCIVNQYLNLIVTDKKSIY